MIVSKIISQFYRIPSKPDFLLSEVRHIDNKIWKPDDSGGVHGRHKTNTQEIERDYMIVLGIMYCCILIGKHSDEEEKRLWEMKHFQEQKVEEKDEWEEQES